MSDKPEPIYTGGLQPLDGTLWTEGRGHSPSQLDTLQKEHWRWMEEVHAILGTEPDVQMRLRRFAEEAAELCQAGGLDFLTFIKVVTDAYSRPVGEFPQEIGGTMVTLLCLAAAKGQSVDECARREFTRIDTPEMKQKIADKQAIKAERGI